MEFTATPSDLIQVAQLAKNIDANPLVLAGRLIGLSGEEANAGVPKWAWVVAGIGVGVAVGIHYGPTIKQKLGLSDE